MHKIIIGLLCCFTVIGGVYPAVAKASETDDLTTKITQLTDEFVLLRSSVVEERKANYNQSFKDDAIGVAFSYDAKKPFKIVPVTSVNESLVTARSFQVAKKEALFMSLNDKAATTQLTFFLSLLSGTSTKDGTTYIANTAMVEEPILSRPLMRTDLKTITKQKKEAGASILFYEVRDEKNAFIGAITMSVGWGEYVSQNSNTKVTKYNGKVVKLKPHFKTKKEADAFVDDMLNTLVVDENKVRASLR